jgi:hypothetical protein|nr:MAG TPA: Major head protein [Caudoviricetes sp.]
MDEEKAVGAVAEPVKPEPQAQVEPDGQRTFTQTEVDALMGRVRRETRGQFSDYEELKAQAERAKGLDEAEERAKRAESALAEAEAVIERQRAVAEVSAETGVPAALLHGGTAEELKASAEAVRAYADSVRPAYPLDKGGAPAGGAAVTAESINAIKDPVARVRARAKHADIYR